MATLLQGNKIIASENFDIKFHSGIVKILEGDLYTIQKVFSLGVELTVNGELESIIFTLKELPQSCWFPLKAINYFDDAVEVDVGRFYEDQSFHINNRIKGLLT